MATTTPRQSLPVMQAGDDPDIPTDITALAVAIEKRLFGVYNDATDRDTRNSAPEEGQVAFLKSVDKVYCYLSPGGWTQIYPQVLPTIYKGSTTPSSGLGVDGDLYVQY